MTATQGAVLRLLVVSTWLPCPLDNGSRVRAYHLLRHLARRHAVTLLAFGAPGSEEGVAALRSLCDHVEVVPPAPLGGSRLRTRGLLSAVPRYFVQTESAPMKALVAAHVRRHDAAISLQVNAAPYLSGWPHIPRIFEEVEVGTYQDAGLLSANPLRGWRRRLTWWKFRRFVRGLVNSFDRSTVVSVPERDLLLAIGCDRNRIDIVPNGTSVPDVLPPRVARAGQLIYTGSVTYSANLDAVRYFVREILPLVRRVRSDVTLVVTGSTDGVDIGDLAAQEGVSFTGWLPDVDSILTESAVCVVPLRIGGGTRLKVLQAMAFGTPVVSTGKGVEGLDLEPERHVLVADGSRAFAAHVLRLLSEPALADALSKNARGLVRERYGWETSGEMLEEVVQRAVADHASRQREDV